MTFVPRLWLSLGAFALLNVAGPAAAAAQLAAPEPAGQGGEGGEGGEGGVDAARAATDPVAFLTALDVIAAHVLAGRDAYAAGQQKAAAEMFAHPIAEVYADMAPAFERLGVPEFEDTLQRAASLATDVAPPPRVARAAGIALEAVAVAEAFAPGEGASASVRAKVLGDMLDRAAQQYATAAREPGELEPYLDGYGFLQAARRRAQTSLAELERAGRGEAAALTRRALVLLEEAYPAASPPPALTAAPGALLAAAARARLALGE